MAPRPRMALAALLLIVGQYACASGLQFYLATGHNQRRCFFDSAPAGTRILGEYTVAAGNGNMQVEMDIRSEDNTVRMFYEPKITHGKFAFVMPVPSQQAHVHHAQFERRPQMPLAAARAEGAGDGTGGHAHSRRLLAVDEHEHHYGANNYGASEHHYGANEHPYDVNEHQYGAGDHRYDPNGYHYDMHSGFRPDEHDPVLRDDPSVHYDPAHDPAGNRVGSGPAPDYHGHHDMRSHQEQLEEHAAHHAKGDYMDDFDDSEDWDMGKYDGLDDEELDREEREVLEAAHRAEMDKYMSSEHDAYGDPMMDRQGVDRAFAEQRYMVCLEGRGDPGGQRRVRLVIRKGEAAMDVHRLAKKEHLNMLELKLRLISAELHELLRQLERAHRMEEGLRAINEGTNSAVMKYAGLSIFAMFVIGAMQARYTKVYFKQKKIA